MSLEEYTKKSDLEKTGESKGEEKEDGSTYVIHRHQATHLHWDLRLEMDGVLKSWAIPKEPPTTFGLKRLAVHVEDHPIDYASFEGTIPQGEYGAGKVEVWDKGSFDLLEKTEDKLVIDIKGEKLKGGYVLVRLKKPGNEKNWLFFKKKE